MARPVGVSVLAQDAKRKRPTAVSEPRRMVVVSFIGLRIATAAILHAPKEICKTLFTTSAVDARRSKLDDLVHNQGRLDVVVLTTRSRTLGCIGYAAIGRVRAALD